MNTNDYIKELKSHLSVLDKAKREEIVREIESYIDESEATYSLLVDRFGKPKDLADGYLEDITMEQGEDNTMYKKTKRVFLTIFIFLVVLFATIAISIYVMTRDPFDYEKFNSANVAQNFEQPWMQIKEISKIDLTQSKVVVYWNSDNKTRLSCKKDDEDTPAENKREIKGDTLFIRQSSCYLSLPNKMIDIKTYQSKVILVRPSNSVNLDTEQSSINIAKKGRAYSFAFEKKQSDVDESLVSITDGIMIKGKLYQSSITTYEY